jgi:hypothetical protein
MKYVLFAVAALAGLGASAALAHNGDHPADHPTTEPPIHETLPPTHPPTHDDTVPPTHPPMECDHQCPPPPPPVTVTVTTQAPPVTIERLVERPSERVVYVDRVVEKRVEVPVEKIVERVVRVPVMKVVYRTKWKTRTVVQRIIRTKVIHDRCPPPDVCCEGKG